MRLHELLLTEADTLHISVSTGDPILVGKFKNRKATIKGFKTDQHDQPVLKTDKGDQKLLKPRVPNVKSSHTD